MKRVLTAVEVGRGRQKSCATVMNVNNCLLIVKISDAVSIINTTSLRIDIQCRANKRRLHVVYEAPSKQSSRV